LDPLGARTSVTACPLDVLETGAALAGAAVVVETAVVWVGRATAVGAAELALVGALVGWGAARVSSGVLVGVGLVLDWQATSRNKSARAPPHTVNLFNGRFVIVARG
jgi:hypothetical protein